MTVTIGPFRLVDPPPGQSDIIRAAIEAIDYPWERLAAAVVDDRDKAVLVEWDDTGGQVSGRFYGGSLRIIMGTRAYQLDEGAGFVFAHEVGHLVDAATFTDADRAALAALFHRGPFAQIGHFNHDHPDAGHVSEEWSDTSNAYVSRLDECYADQFVAAFAPTLWAGRGVRFVHWTDDHAEIRRLTLARDLTPAPKPKPTPIPEPEVRTVKRQGRYVRRALRLGLMKRLDGRFRPRARMTRAQVARALVRLHDKLTKR